MANPYTIYISVAALALSLVTFFYNRHSALTGDKRRELESRFDFDVRFPLRDILKRLDDSWQELVAEGRSLKNLDHKKLITEWQASDYSMAISIIERILNRSHINYGKHVLISLKAVGAEQREDNQLAVWIAKIEDQNERLELELLSLIALLRRKATKREDIEKAAYVFWLALAENEDLIHQYCNEISARILFNEDREQLVRRIYRKRFLGLF